VTSRLGTGKPMTFFTVYLSVQEIRENFQPVIGILEDSWILWAAAVLSPAYLRVFMYFCTYKTTCWYCVFFIKFVTH
jgi:hypothetical protein